MGGRRDARGCVASPMAYARLRGGDVGTWLATRITVSEKKGERKEGIVQIQTPRRERVNFSQRGQG